MATEKLNINERLEKAQNDYNASQARLKELDAIMKNKEKELNELKKIELQQKDKKEKLLEQLLQQKHKKEKLLEQLSFFIERQAEFTDPAEMFNHLRELKDKLKHEMDETDTKIIKKIEELQHNIVAHHIRSQHDLVTTIEGTRQRHCSFNEGENQTVEVNEQNVCYAKKQSADNKSINLTTNYEYMNTLNYVTVEHKDDNNSEIAEN